MTMTCIHAKPYARVDWRGFMQLFQTLDDAKRLVGGGGVIWYQGGIIYTRNPRGAWGAKPAVYVRIEEWENLK